MSDLENLAAKASPGSEPPAWEGDKLMFSSQPKLSMPDEAIPGYKCYWFRGTPGRISFALRVGFQFVRPDEVTEWLANSDLGSDRTLPGSTDMGDRVSVSAQEGVGGDGQFLRLYLMKIEREKWEKAMDTYTRTRIDPIVEAFKAGMVDAGKHGETSTDVSRRYVKNFEIPEMFKRKGG